MIRLPDWILVFNLNGERKQLAFRKLAFSAWSELKAQLGFTPATIWEAASLFDLEAIGAIIWLERKQHERMLHWIDVRRELETVEFDFEPIDFITDGKSLMGLDEPVVETEPDPTQAGS